MRIKIESTPNVTTYNGARVRAWRGYVLEGNRLSTPCTVYVAGIAVDREHDQAVFERDLLEQQPPRELKLADTLRMREIL